MNRRALINLILFALAAVLAGIAYLDLSRSGVTALPTLTDLSPDTITEVRIRRGEGDEIHLVKDAGRWQMRTPYLVPAADERINRLLPIAATPIRRRFSVAEAELARFGLAAPELRLELNGVGIDFGATEPVRYRRYTLIQDEIRLIDNGFQHHLIAPAEDYVSRRILPEGAKVDAARSKLRPLDPTVLTDLAADTVSPLRGSPEGIELEIWLVGDEKPIACILSYDRRELALPERGVLYGFRDPLPLRPASAP
jgi:hypothetical protein